MASRIKLLTGLMLFFVGILIAAPLVHAASEPTYLPDILVAPGPIPNPVKKEPQVAGIAPWSFGFSFASDVVGYLFGIGGESYPQVHTVKVPNVEPDGTQIEGAAVRLLSKTLQKACVKLITYDQRMTANHRNCFKDEIGGSSHVPTQNILGNVYPGLNMLRGGTELMYTITSIGSRSCEALNLYNTEPDETVTPDNGLPCGTQETDVFPTGLFQQSTPEHKYERSADPFQATANIFCPAGVITKYLKCKVDNLSLPADEQEDCSFSCSSGAHTVYSTLWSGAQQMMDHLGRGEDDTCTGFTCAFIPKAFSLTKNHGTNTEDHQLTLEGIINDNVTSEKAAYYELAQEKEHMEAMNCGNMSKAQRMLVAPDKNCVFNVSTGGTTIPPGPITNNVDKPPAPSCQDGIDEAGFDIVPGDLAAAITQATNNKIPRCVLQGVANIEGAAAEIASDTCSPNQCSATGPFQITVGFTYSGSGDSCNKDTTCAACGLSECPDSLPTGINPCDTVQAAKGAVSLLIGKAASFGKTLDIKEDKDAIITAGDSYYGLPIPIEKFGGCSYGEWIYKDACGHSGYVCAPHKLPLVKNPPL